MEEQPHGTAFRDLTKHLAIELSMDIGASGYVQLDGNTVLAVGAEVTAVDLPTKSPAPKAIPGCSKATGAFRLCGHLICHFAGTTHGKLYSSCRDLYYPACVLTSKTTVRLWLSWQTESCVTNDGWGRPLLRRNPV